MDIVTYALLNGKIKDYASNVDEWLEENVDPATGYVLDRSLQMENAAAPADIVGDINDDVGELRNTLINSSERTTNLIHIYNGYKEKDGNGYYGDNGEIIETQSWQYCEEYIPVMPNTVYSPWHITTYIAVARISIVWYTIDKKLISRVNTYEPLTSPENAYYCRLSFNSASEMVMFIEGSTAPITYVPYGYKVSNKFDDELSSQIENVSDAILPIEGATFVYTDETFTEKNGYIDKFGILQTGNNWKHAVVDVEGGNTYHVKATSSTGCYALMIYDEYHLIKTVPEVLAVQEYEMTIRIPSDAKKIIINKSTAGIVLKKATGISVSGILEKANILFGKKLYCGGDSITEGAGVGTFPNGYKKTYGGHVATRNNMIYVSDGVGGSTMGKCTVNGTVLNNFITSRYLNIPTDADFITLWFGWNDNAYGYQSMRDAYCVAQYGTYYNALTAEQKAEVDAYKTWREWLADYAGTKDSTDITTWGGAWNTVLAWILEHCPDAHVGVVLAYGTDDALINVLIDICKKYGYGYVSASDVHEFFSVGYSDGIGMSQAAGRKELYTLDGTHPNESGYSMMSNSYEQFLKRI